MIICANPQVERLYDQFTSPLSALEKTVKRVVTRQRQLSWDEKKLSLEQSRSELKIANRRLKLGLELGVQRVHLSLPVSQEVLDSVELYPSQHHNQAKVGLADLSGLSG